MKKILLITCAFCIVFLSSCKLEDNSIQGKVSDKSPSGSSSVAVSDSGLTFFPIKTYGVYEIFNGNSDENEFDETLLNNPIDQKMDDEMKTSNISSTREAQIFFDGYVKVWQDELEFSISNLKNIYRKKILKTLKLLKKHGKIICN